MTTVRRTGRWRGIVAVTLFATVVGLLVERPSVLLLGVVGAGFAAYPHLSGPPTVALDLERRVDSRTPGRADTVEVTTSVTNRGDGTLVDLRVIDGVPAMLTVGSGSPRHGTVLRPGETTEFSYELASVPGRHQFEPATVVARDLTGAHEVEDTVSVDTEIECSGTVPSVPLRSETNAFPGDLETEEGGSGTEFHTVREYRRGDPMGRVDWKRWARTGDLTTVEFREERAATVVFLVDAREPAYRARSDHAPNAVAYALTTLDQLLDAFETRRDFVGLAALGREFCFHPPGVGRTNRRRLRRLLTTHPTLSESPPDRTDPDAVDTQVDRLRERLGPDAQVVVLSPLLDDGIRRAVRALSEAGHATTVISPDVTADGSAGARLAALERENRIHALRRVGVVVIDRDPTEPLGTELPAGRRQGWAA